MRKTGFVFTSLTLLSTLFILAFTDGTHTTPTPPVVEEASNAVEGVTWLTWEEAVELNKKAPKKIVVDIYTDWCGWCKRMDAATFQQKHIAEYINEHYYAVKFDGEQKETIDFKGKTYQFVNSGRRGYHELAAEITQGRLGYPTIVFMDEGMNVIQAINGFKGPEDFEMIMTYFAQDFHKKLPWDKYARDYQPLQKGATTD